MAQRKPPQYALQVEMGEMPLEIRREQMSMVYWAHLRGHGENHPAQSILKPCQEKEKEWHNVFDGQLKTILGRVGQQTKV